MDVRRVWLNELMAKPHLWPNQVAVLKMLAEEIGVDVVIMDKPLNGGDWHKRQEVRGGSE